MATAKAEKSNISEGKKCDGTEGSTEKVTKTKDQKNQKAQKNQKGQQVKKVVVNEKTPGWLKDPKFLYSDDYVQNLVKKNEVPGVGGSDGVKSQSERPLHKAKVQIKINESVLKEAVKVHEILDKLVVKMKEGKEEKGSPAKDVKSNAEEPRAKEVKSEAKVEKKSKGKVKKNAK